MAGFMQRKGSIRSQEQLILYGPFGFYLTIGCRKVVLSAFINKLRESLQPFFYELSWTGEIPTHEAFAFLTVNAAGIEP